MGYYGREGLTVWTCAPLVKIGDDEYIIRDIPSSDLYAEWAPYNGYVTERDVFSGRLETSINRNTPVENLIGRLIKRYPIGELPVSNSDLTLIARYELPQELISLVDWWGWRSILVMCSLIKNFSIPAPNYNGSKCIAYTEESLFLFDANNFTNPFTRLDFPLSSFLEGGKRIADIFMLSDDSFMIIVVFMGNVKGYKYRIVGDKVILIAEQFFLSYGSGALFGALPLTEYEFCLLVGENGSVSLNKITLLDDRNVTATNLGPICPENWYSVPIFSTYRSFCRVSDNSLLVLTRDSVYFVTINGDSISVTLSPSGLPFPNNYPVRQLIPVCMDNKIYIVGAVIYEWSYWGWDLYIGSSLAYIGEINNFNISWRAVKGIPCPYYTTAGTYFNDGRIIAVGSRDLFLFSTRTQANANKVKYLPVEKLSGRSVYCAGD